MPAGIAFLFDERSQLSQRMLSVGVFLSIGLNHNHDLLVRLHDLFDGSDQLHRRVDQRRRAGRLVGVIVEALHLRDRNGLNTGRWCGCC